MAKGQPLHPNEAQMFFTEGPNQQIQREIQHRGKKTEDGYLNTSPMGFGVAEASFFIKKQNLAKILSSYPELMKSLKKKEEIEEIEEEEEGEDIEFEIGLPPGKDTAENTRRILDVFEIGQRELLKRSKSPKELDPELLARFFDKTLGELFTAFCNK